MQSENGCVINKSVCISLRLEGICTHAMYKRNDGNEFCETLVLLNEVSSLHANHVSHEN